MEFVIIESPYAGDVAANTAYARACVADSLRRGEAPYASHLLYTQPGIYDDSKPQERAAGLAAAMEVARRGSLTAVYYDRGVSSGMVMGIRNARACGRRIELRSLEGKPVPAELIALLQGR